MRIFPVAAATFGVIALISQQEARAQVSGVDSDALAGVLDLIVDPEVTADEIGQQLTACLRPIYDDELPHSNIIFTTRFDSEGNPSAPQLEKPSMAHAESGHLRQLFRAEAALFDCSPLSIGGSPVIDVVLAFEATATDIHIAPDEAEDTVPATLSRAKRREMQIRLRLAGSDPGGADGVFGPNTRDAISKWQDENGFIPSGTLTEQQVEALTAATETAYTDWKARQPAVRKPQRQRFYRGSDGCLRYSNGKIVPSQSFKCDAKGLVQSF